MGELALNISAGTQVQGTTLSSLRNQKRVLLVFANGDNREAEAQLTVAAGHAEGFRERDLVLAGIAGTNPAVPTVTLTPKEEARAGQRFHVRHGEFTVVLLGKDGGEKLRSHAAVSWESLQGTIDAMPMRKDEMRQGRAAPVHASSSLPAR